MSGFGVIISDKVSAFVGTWTFVSLYTLSMVIWIFLHEFHILHIDSQDFIKWNLWLSYFAGTQASIVLMSSERRAIFDRIKQEQNFLVDETTLQLTQSNNDKIKDLTQQIVLLEEVIEDLLNEKMKETRSWKK